MSKFETQKMQREIGMATEGALRGPSAADVLRDEARCLREKARNLDHLADAVEHNSNEVQSAVLDLYFQRK